MLPLSDLVNEAESALPFVCETASQVTGRCVVHPPSPNAGEVLHQCQVTTRSPMGAIVYHTGGITIEGGWLRILGSGCLQIPRSMSQWNAGRSSGYLLVANDAVGGFFAIDGGSLGHAPGTVCYFCPKALEWVSLEGGFSEFLVWACNDFGDFYTDLRWPDWQTDVALLSGDRTYSFYPFLWAKEGSVTKSRKTDIPVTEAFEIQMDMARQLSEQ